MQKLVEKKKVFNNARVKENLNENSYASARGNNKFKVSLDISQTLKLSFSFKYFFKVNSSKSREYTSG